VPCWYVCRKRHIAAQKTLYEQLIQEHEKQQELLYQIVREEDVPTETDFTSQLAVTDICKSISL